MKTKMILMALVAIVTNAVMGGTLALAVGLPVWSGAVGLNAVALVLPAVAPAGSLLAGVYSEVWTGEMVKALRGGMDGKWLDGIPDASSLVNNDVIHLVEVGVDPDVLVNNTTYPIPLQALEDQDIAVQLDKFQSKVTPVTSDELYAIAYDKMARVKESHGNAINDAKFAKAAHALCAQRNTASTPVLSTTGEKDAATGRLKMTMQDVISLKRSLDGLGVPAEDRRLVLCSDHVNDLLEAEQTFREQYNVNRQEGLVGRLYGFDVYEYGRTPLYSKAGEKKALDAAGGDGEFRCSFAFYAKRVFRATGSTMMYYSEAATDPEYQRNKISFTHHFICMPKKADAGAVIMSACEAGL